MDTIPQLTVSGNAFERGRLHGERFAAEVVANINTYLERFDFSGFARGAALEEGGNWLAAIGRHDADYYEEMEGIARGAGCDLREIALINARYEIAFTLYGKEAKKRDELLSVGPDGCTTFGLLPQVTADGHTWLGQNWDWLEAIHGRTLVLRVRSQGQPSFICLTEAGIVGGKMAVNECGVGLVENGLASSFDGANPYEAPFHVRCRQIARAERYEDALGAVVSTKRTCSGNFVVGHSGGEIIDLETSPSHVSYLYPEGGVITHSNHFVGTSYGESLMERISPNTLYRAARLRRLLMAGSGKIAVARMQEALKDKFGTPNAICRVPDPKQAKPKRSMTAAAVLIDLDARVLHVANGPPSTYPFVPFPLHD